MVWNDIAFSYLMSRYSGNGSAKGDKNSMSAELDTNDTQKCLALLQFRSPFDPHVASLQSIDTGVIADESVNVDKAADAGKKIVKWMIWGARVCL